MKTRFFNGRYLVYYCVCAVWLPLLYVRAEDGNTQNNQNTFTWLRERIDAAIRMSETNENARTYPDVRSDIFWNATQRVKAMGKLGDRAALPFLEEKSLMTNAPSSFRFNAALAYVKIANVDESVGLVRKLYEDTSMQGQFDLITKDFLKKVNMAEKSMTPKTREEINSLFLEIVQTAKTPRDARSADFFLFDRIPEYADSKQRATLSRYANTGTEYTTNTFNPIKAHFDKIPPAKRVDLRKRFPDLPPLPEDKNAGTPLKVALGIGAALVAVCAVVWVTVKWRRTRNHAGGCQ